MVSFYPPQTPQTPKGPSESIRELVGHIESTVDDEFARLEAKYHWFHNFPWVAFLALLSSLSCGGGVFIVFFFCENRTPADWIPHVTPNMLITVLSSFSTIMLGIAITHGVAINWWRQVLKGSTIKELHRSWAFSSSVFQLVFGGRYFNFIALAALMAKFAVIDGVLFQRAISTVSTYEPNSTDATFVGSHRTTFPLTGYLDGNGNKTTNQNYGFNGIFYWWLESPYKLTEWYGDSNKQNLNITNCDDYCNGNLTGAGFAWTCDVLVEDIDYGAQSVKYYKQDNGTQTDKYEDLVLFSSTFGENLSKTNSTLSATFVSTSAKNPSNDTKFGSCPATKTTTTCTLIPAVIQYDISYVGSDDTEAGQTDPYWYLVQYGDLYLFENFHDSVTYQSEWPIVEPLTVKEPMEKWGETYLGGIYIAMQTTFGSSVTMSYRGDNTSDGGFYTTSTGLVGQNLVKNIPTSEFCSYEFRNATSYVYEALSAWTFMMSYSIADFDDNSDMSPFEVHAYRWPLTVKYLVNWHYYLGGMGSMIFCVLCILPTFWGYWELSRKVSLGPFEIAHAFGAPMLVQNNHRDHGGEVKIMLKDIGKTKVQLTGADGSARVVVVQDPTAFGGQVHMQMKDNEYVTGMMVSDREGNTREIRPMSQAEIRAEHHVDIGRAV